MSGRLRKRNREDESELEAQEPAEGLADGDSPPSSPASVEELRRECEELRERWLRAQADYQNLKRRQLADIESALRRAQSGLLESLLIVLDHLDMALAFPTETEEARSLAQGVRLTRDQLVGALAREDVLPIPTDGPFDPEVHQAVAILERPDLAPGTILEVSRPGWSHRGLVLRPAQVKVAAAPGDAPAAGSPPRDPRAEEGD